MILEGRNRDYIITFAEENNWGVTVQVVDDYIRRIMAEMAAIGRQTMQENVGIITSALWDLFRFAKIDNDIGEQRMILMSIAKIMGLDNQRVTHVVEDQRELKTYTDEELDDIIKSENTPSET